MEIVKTRMSGNGAAIDLTPYKREYSLDFLNTLYHHAELSEALAPLIKEGHVETQMIIIESQRLADEYWDDPKYMHKTNHLCFCEAQQDARKELVNRYFRTEALVKFSTDNDLSTWKYNYKEQEEKERIFKFEVEDAIFEYQERLKIAETVIDAVKEAETYLFDECGYVQCKDDMNNVEGVEFDDEGYALVKDPEVIKQQRDSILHRLLKPKMMTEHARVYDMPDPFCHWDYRSFWHQWFAIVDKRTNQIVIHRGNSGSSGAREENGRWGHTFCHLAKVHGIETHTSHLLYNKHNQLELRASYDTFKSLRYDLCGNYQVESYSEVDKLFEGRYLEILTKEDRMW